jgi:hypothetical protein
LRTTRYRPGAHSRIARCSNQSIRSSPRIDQRLLIALERLDDPVESVAELHRRLGVVADALDLPRPNYETVRLLVRRNRRSMRRPPRRDAVLDLALYTRSPRHAIEDLLSPDP